MKDDQKIMDLCLAMNWRKNLETSPNFASTKWFQNAAVQASRQQQIDDFNNNP